MVELDESCRNGVNRAVVWQDDVDVGDLTVSFDVRSIRLSEKYIGGAGVSDGGWGSKIYFWLKCCFVIYRLIVRKCTLVACMSEVSV